MPDLQFHTLRFDTLPSTNLEAARRAREGAAEGLCIVASEQTAGRGRLGRQWLSPRNAGIYCSTLLRPQFDPNLWPLITLMSAVVVHEALLAACDLETDIKWPNDILHDNKKLCGILAEIVETPSGRAVIVGIGINLTNDSFPPELAAAATSVSTATGRYSNVEDVLVKLQQSFVCWYRRLNQPKGAGEIVTAWSEHSSYADGKEILITDSAAEFYGTTRGLTMEGALKVETETGEVRIVRAGDVSLRSG
ncbi:MAG TPA: biotin--[acetyl-CoA-carboxylase] ligase [Pyrinomonadaceae bacterium]|nr:biotin--[acetyl-CoA-carboxylase] ligase [Pyrinomonadaceae bacterium]